MPLPSAASRQASQPALAPLSKLALGGGGSSGGAGGGSASVEEVNELVQRLVVMDSMNLQLQVWSSAVGGPWAQGTLSTHTMVL